MKFLAIVIFLLGSTAFAEHDKTYCGEIQNPVGSDHVAILKLSYLRNINAAYEDDNFITLYSYAEIAHVDEGSVAHKKLNKFLKSKTKAVICVKARWGGSMFDHNLDTDSVYRIDYRSRFSGQD